ncbi:class I SAM-dependent methyltransferase [Polynucleobacter sp. MWH-Svant-W18]|uniref:class I SAM-dependent methyltransferase n=1 Tax=Polynucleobacter sp. MWH-Svant-W18 TaxID=1855909 RepID=UPI001BFD99FD|nr:class I SAM-dependent methyltransferase [Polynucleobacter sp. MWH-Svant-W18]QWD78492.1 class I SAM-dependent methyltransferase [Polynucleobacter sp. MWH-Svant-W18]
MIYKSWDEIPIVSNDQHDQKYLDILKKHNLDKIEIVVPLKGRYTKSRRWEESELEEIINAWINKTSITFVSACLNRNPQDMIYKLLKYCKSKGIPFTQKERSESSKNWTEQVKNCAVELFESGLPAWKIATTFRVDFEHVEKELFLKRNHYGHDKKNPFGINTDHKQLVNEEYIENSNIQIKRVFEPYAGEGRFTKILLTCSTIKEIICIESNKETADVFRSSVRDKRVKFIEDDNLTYFQDKSLGKFDLIDLDPFITCNEQLKYVWDRLNNKSLLCVTFGGEYRRSFISTNRKSISNRYGFTNFEIPNKDYLEIVPSYFIGYVAKMAVENNFYFDIVRAVRYANNCRFWLRTTKSNSIYCTNWLSSVARVEDGGTLFKSLQMPRFKEVRSEIDNARLL